jgi:drug/metabolite transporter (DMT)-like permease
LNSHFVLYWLISIMVLLWPVNFVVVKSTLQQFPPRLLGGLRIGLAGLFIAPVYWWKSSRGDALRPRACPLRASADVPALLLLALFCIGNQLLFIFGLNRTSVPHSAILIGMSPIFVLLIAAAQKIEPITAQKITGMLIALAGIAILHAIPEPQAQRTGGPTLSGDALMCLAGLTFASFTVLGKRVSLRHDSITVNSVAYILGALAFAPILFWQARHFTFAAAPGSAWAGLIYMALFPSVVCYLIYFYALTRIPASRVSAFSYLQPVIATLLAATLLGESLSIPVVGGGAVILAGVYLTERG